MPTKKSPFMPNGHAPGAVAALDRERPDIYQPAILSLWQEDVDSPRGEWSSCTMGQFFDNNPFFSEELMEILLYLGRGLMYQGGGGASPPWIVALYEPLHERLSFKNALKAYNLQAR